jgi:hypothetical protein
MLDVEELYLQHLSEADRRLLAEAAGRSRPTLAALADPAVEKMVLSGGEAGVKGQASRLGEGLIGTTPFLTFAVAVHRTAAMLETTTYVEERWRPRQRVPVFDVAPLRELLSEPLRRYFLIELLASYTHVTSGVTWEKTTRGWRRRRFSELDPLRLAGLLETVSPPERAGVYRRLGDLALFLTGVFRDHASLFEIGASGVERLRRLSALPNLGLRAAEQPAPPTMPGSSHSGTQELLEQLGARWYAAAAHLSRAHGAPLTYGLELAAEMGRRFDDARRVLNVVTDRYLFPVRQRWFGLN